jgi:hypothetical protein
MSHARTVGLTAAIVLVASLILAIALDQPASNGPAGDFRRSRKARRSWKAGQGDLKEVNYA